MPIQVRCHSCDVTFEIADHLDGTTVRCPKCQRPIKAHLTEEKPTDVAAGAPAGPTALAQGPPPVPAASRRHGADRSRGRRSSSKGALIAGGIVAVLLGVCGIGSLAVFGIGGWLFWSSPREARRIAEAQPAEVAVEVPNNPLNVPPPIGDGPVIVPPMPKPPENEPAKPIVIPAALDPNGVYHANGELTAADARDTSFPMSPHKRYEMVFEAGRTYVIDHVSQDFDAYLRLTDETGKELARDDDGGGNLNARIRFPAPRTGRYFVHASQLSPRPGHYTLTIRADSAGIVLPEKKLDEIKLPVATSPNVAAPNAAQNLVGGGKVTTVLFNGAAVLVGDALWSRDGTAILVLDSNGVLHRLRADDWVEERRLDLGRRAANLTLSGMGLLVALPEQQEVWFINIRTLAVIRRLNAPAVRRVVSAPKLKIAVAATTGGVLLLELPKGGSVRSFGLPNQHLAIAPDGSRLFVQGAGEQLVRYRIDARQIIKEEESPRIAQNGQGIHVSPDGKYVCLPSAGGNYGGLADHPEIAPYSTYVYAADNLRRPAFAVASGAYPRVVGFDPVGGYVFAQNSKVPLLVFSPTGEKKHEFTFDKGGTAAAGEPREFVAHPQGNRVLIRFDKRLAVVELPAAN
jgi:hypothetical protein